MNRAMLRFLVSLCCRAEMILQPAAEVKGRVIEGTIACGRCGKQFPVSRGVPRFVEGDEYTTSFSFEWQIHRRTRFDSARSIATREDFGRKIDIPLVRKLAPGGRISIHVYPAYDRLHRNVSRFLRKFTTRLPKRVLYNLCKVAIPLHYVEKIPILGRLFAILIPTGAVYEDPQWRVLNTFDWYSPHYQWKHTVEEVFAWFASSPIRYRCGERSRTATDLFS
jgi:uncharacterized protein YbaR (Trm112 family)